MKPLLFIRLVLSLICVWLSVPPSSAADPVAEEIVKKLASAQIDAAIFPEILRMPTSPELTGALKGAFDRQHEGVTKQRLAATLVGLGDRDPTFYNYLVNKAEQALASSAPNWVAYDSAGRSIAGQVSPEFRAWCTLSGVDIRDGIARQSREGDDVAILANTRDARANGLLVRALNSSNGYVVLAAAQNLALRRLDTAIPAIVAAAERWPPAAAWVIANTLALYGTADADREMRRLIRDPQMIAGFKKMAASQRGTYELRDRAKLGLSSPGNLLAPEK
jgi:hypothetical protein